MRNLILILLAAIVFTACSEYQKVFRNEEIGSKFKLGEQLYKEGKYNKANKLFQQIVPNYRGKAQAEKLMFLYATSFYHMKDYYTAAYQLERFVSAYPKSEKIQETSFLAAKSKYMMSPVFSKDQTETTEAIEQFQLFINTYPNSKFVTEANKYVKELDAKLEEKAYEIAYQYLKTVPYTRDYRAAISSFDKFLLDFPGTKRREDVLYNKLVAAYGLAVNSVEYKKQKRLETAKTYYHTFKKAYGESNYIENANKMHNTIVELLNAYKTKS